MKPAQILRQLFSAWEAEISMMQERVKAGMLKSRSKELYLEKMASFLQPHQSGLIQMLLDLGVKLAVPDVNPSEGVWKFTYSEDQVANVLAFHEIFKKLKVHVENAKAAKLAEENKWVDDSDMTKGVAEVMDGTPMYPEDGASPTKLAETVSLSAVLHPPENEEDNPDDVFFYQTMNLVREFISKRGSIGFGPSSLLAHFNVQQLYNHLDNLDLATNGELELPVITQEMRAEWHRRDLGQPGSYIPNSDVPWSHLTEQKFLEQALFDALSKFWHSFRKYMKPSPVVSVREVQTPQAPAPVERKMPDEVEDPDRGFERTWIKALTQLEMIRRELNIIPYGHVSIPTVDIPRHLMKCFGGDVHLGHEIGALFVPMGEVKNLITELITAATDSIRSTYKFHD